MRHKLRKGQHAEAADGQQQAPEHDGPCAYAASQKAAGQAEHGKGEAAAVDQPHEGRAVPQTEQVEVEQDRIDAAEYQADNGRADQAEAGMRLNWRSMSRYITEEAFSGFGIAGGTETEDNKAEVRGQWK